jgi:hypothetical protein
MSRRIRINVLQRMTSGSREIQGRGKHRLGSSLISVE